MSSSEERLSSENAGKSFICKNCHEDLEHHLFVEGIGYQPKCPFQASTYVDMNLTEAMLFMTDKLKAGGPGAQTTKDFLKKNADTFGKHIFDDDP